MRGTRLLAILALMALTAGPFVQAAKAQAALALVNSTPITSLDVAQRIRIAQLTENRRLDQRAALNELIDDQVKLVHARHSGFRITEDGVDAEYTRMGRAGGRSIAQFDEALKQAGINPSNLRDKIRADLAWQVLLRDQSRKGAQVSSAEIEQAVQQELKSQRQIVDYSLQNVIFVVPRGTSPGAREQAANAARGRFAGCENGFDAFRAMNDVAVRPPTFRSTEGMSPQLAAVLAKTPVGKLTPPFRTEQGIEMVAVCERKPREASANLRSEIATRLSETRMTANARGFLQEIRKTVDIRMMR
ncbi:M3B_PepF domain containing protein [Rhabdaerophilaceae bacterium]